MLRARLAFSLGCAIWLAASPIAVAAQRATPTTATPTAASDQSNYVLGVDDKVMITVFGEDSLSKEYVVGPNGMLSIPLIGDVKAIGRQMHEVSDEIRQKLADGYLKDPSVSMQITAFRPFYILGEVNKPGEYPYRDGLTITAAVATAEGYTYRARKQYVFIKHAGQQQEVRVQVTPDLLVQPGDTIRFGERYF